MSDFISAENVLVGQKASTREELLHLVCDRAVELGLASDADAVFAAFMAREGMGETGMTDGFAIPHAKCAQIERAGVVVVKNAEPLDWPSFDEKPVTCAIALLVPDTEAGTKHIEMLSQVAVLLMDAGFKNFVRGCDDAGEIADAIESGIEG